MQLRRIVINHVDVCFAVHQRNWDSLPASYCTDWQASLTQNCCFRGLDLGTVGQLLAITQHKYGERCSTAWSRKWRLEQFSTRCRANARRTARCRCNFDTYHIWQRHRAVSLPQHAFLVGLCQQTAVNSVKKWQVLERTSQIAYLTQTSNHVITLHYHRHHYSPPT